MSHPSQAFENKEYEELTETQQEIIDELEENPNRIDEEIAEIVGCSGPYVNVARNVWFGDEEMDELDEFFDGVEVPQEESSAEGEEKTVIEDNLFSNLQETRRPQTFKERPYTNTLTTEQEDYIDNLPVPEYQKKVIRFKVRNPDANQEDVAEALEIKASTANTYMNKCRQYIEEAFRRGETVSQIRKEIEEETEETDVDTHQLSLSTEDIVSIMSTPTVTKETREKIIEELAE